MARRGPKPRKKTPAPAEGLWGGFEPPPDMPAAALAEFDRLVLALDQVGTLGRTDPRLVLTAARTAALVERATAQVEAEGLTLEASNGTLMKHPMLATMNTLTMRLRGLWGDMGLTPATAKLGQAKDADADNPWANLLSVTG